MEEGWKTEQCKSWI